MNYNALSWFATATAVNKKTAAAAAAAAKASATTAKAPAAKASATANKATSTADAAAAATAKATAAAAAAAVAAANAAAKAAAQAAEKNAAQLAAALAAAEDFIGITVMDEIKHEGDLKALEARFAAEAIVVAERLVADARYWRGCAIVACVVFTVVVAVVVAAILFRQRRYQKQVKTQLDIVAKTAGQAMEVAEAANSLDFGFATIPTSIKQPSRILDLIAIPKRVETSADESLSVAEIIGPMSPRAPPPPHPPLPPLRPPTPTPTIRAKQSSPAMTTPTSMTTKKPERWYY